MSIALSTSTFFPNNGNGYVLKYIRKINLKLVFRMKGKQKIFQDIQEFVTVSKYNVIKISVSPLNVLMMEIEKKGELLLETQKRELIDQCLITEREEKVKDDLMWH